jgi:hypothetical protein
MRRYVFYLTVALLAFGIGVFAVIKVYFFTNEQPSYGIEEVKINGNEESHAVTDLERETEGIKFGCKEKWLEASLGNLDEKSLQDEWKDLDEVFYCSDLSRIVKEVDLNNDGENEIFISGKEVSNRGDSETYIFQKKNGKYKIILFDPSSIEKDIKRNKTKKYSDLVFSTNYVTTRRTHSIYKFNGERYERKKCLSEDHEIWKNGKIIGYSEKTIITQIPCD